MDKIGLSAKLAELYSAETVNISKEQYATDVSTAVEFLTFVDDRTRINGRTIADLGCGNGILGIGAALLGAKNVHMYENDHKMVEMARKNTELFGLDNCTVVEGSFFDATENYDIVISNPPFGFQSTFNIEAFVIKSCRMGRSVFFIYKDNKGIRKLAESNGMAVESFGKIVLKRTARFHKKDKYYLPISVVYKSE